MEAAHRLVYELATYEKAAEEVVTTPNTFEKDFKSGCFLGLIAEDHKKNVIGMAMYFYSYSTWKGRILYLDDLVVDEKWRRHGVGKELFDAIVTEAKRSGVTVMKWQVLDWNQPALDFYAKYDATIEKDWWNGKLKF